MADILDEVKEALRSGKPVPDELLLRLEKEATGQPGAAGAIAARVAERGGPAPDPSPVESFLATRALSPLVAGYKDYAELELGMAKLGISGALNQGTEYPFAAQQERDAGKLYQRTVLANGWHFLNGPGIPARKRQLLDAARAYVKVRDTHWAGPDQEQYAAAMLDRMIQEQVDRGQEQLRGLAGGTTGVIHFGGEETTAESGPDIANLTRQQMNLAAAAAVLRRQAPAARATLVRMALARARRPTNPEEEADRLMSGNNWAIGRAVNDATSALGELMSYAHPTSLLGSGSHSPEELMILTRKILGPGTEELIARAYEETRANYFAHKLGILQDPARIITTGTSRDGATFLDFVGPGVVADLTLARAGGLGEEERKTLLKLDPRAWAVYSEAEEAGDHAYAEQVSRASVGRVLALGAAAGAAEAGLTVPNPLSPMGIEEARPLTPAEWEIAGSVRKIQTGLFRIGSGLADFFSATGRDLDAVVSAVPGVVEASRVFVNEFSGRRDQGLADTARTVSDALSIAVKMAMDRGSLFPNKAYVFPFGAIGPRVLKDSTEGVVAEIEIDPALKGLGPEARRAILEVMNDPIKAMVGEPARDIERRTRRMNDMIDGRRPTEPAQLTIDVLRVGSHNAWKSLLGMMGIVADTPSEAASLLLGGASVNAVNRATWGRLRTAHERALAAARLDHQLRQIAAHHPGTAKRLLEGTKTALREAVKQNDPGEVRNRLHSAAAVLSQVVKEINTTGAVTKVDDVARTLGGVWSDIKSHLGDLGAALGSRRLDPSLVERLRGAWAEITGSRGLPDKALTYVVQNMGGLDPALEGARALLGSGKDGIVLRNNILAFQDANGRPPRPDELRALYPQSVLDLNGAMLAGKRSADVRNPGLIRVLRRFWPNWRQADRLAALVDAGEDIVAAGVQASVDDIGLRQVWTAGPRPRNELLLNVALDKVRSRLSDADLEGHALDHLRRQPSADMEQVELASQANLTTRQALSERAQLLQEALDRLNKHDPRQPWRYTDRVRDLVREEVDPETLSLALDAFPGMWEGLDSSTLWQGRRAVTIEEVAAVKSEMQAHRKEWERGRSMLEAARKNPTDHDSMYASIREAETALVAKIDAQKATGALPDRVDVADLEAARSALEQRVRALRAGEAEPDGADLARANMAAARQAHAAAAARMAEGRRPVRVVDPAGLSRVESLLRHEGAPEHLIATAERLEGVVKSLEGARRTRPTDNYFSLWHLPVWLRGEAIPLALRNGDALLAVEGARWGHILDRVRKLPEAERLTYEAGVREGRLPREVLAKYPYLRRQIEVARGEGAMSAVEGLDAIWNDERHLVYELFEEMRRSRMVPDSVVDGLKDLGYDPPVYGLYERKGLIEEPLAAQLIAAKGRRPTGPSLAFGRAVEGDALRLKRHDTEWRVKIDEPPGTVNEFFDSEEAARKYLRRRYGENPIVNERKGEDAITGQTPFGDRVTIATPIGEKALKVLDPVFGHTAERRLQRFHEISRDLASYNVLETISGIPGLVMDDAEFTRLSLAKTSDRLLAQFEKMPNNPERYGPIADKHVHRSVLGAMRRAAGTYDRLRSMVEGIMEGITAERGTALATAARIATGVVEGGFNLARKLVRQTQVLLSPATWIANVVTQTFSDYLAGSKVFTTESADTWRWLLSGRFKDDPLYLLARQHGITDGFFPEETGLWRDTAAEMLGLQGADAQAARALHERRRSLLDEAYQARLAGDERRIVELEQDIAAANAAVREADLHWIKRFGRWTAEWFIGGTRDATGASISANNQKLRRWYNFIDEGFKLMQFKNLIDRGSSPAEAAWTVRQFSQMYSEVPWWLRTTPVPLASTIVSFPFEAARITKNALLSKPLETIAFFGAVPALNFATLAVSGISWDRFTAMLDARGARDAVSATSRFMFSLWVPDGRGNIAMEVDLGGWFALGGLLKAKGIVGQVYNQLYPPDQRKGLGEAAGTMAGFASNFIGNNLPLNMIGQMLTGNDPLTGRAITDPDAPAMEKVRATFRAFFQATVPLGRFAVNYGRADDDVISPGTGRPFQRPYKSEVVLRTLTNVGLKGDLNKGEPLVDDTDIAFSVMYRVAQTLDPKRKLGQYATEGARNQRRELLYRSMSEAKSDTERAEAREELERHIKETATKDLGFMQAVVGRTEREVATEIKRMMEVGVETFFASLPIHAQAAVIAELDRAQVGDSLLRDLIDSSQWTPRGRMAWEDDPDRVKEAIAYLKKASEAEGHNPRIDAWRADLEDFTLPVSENRRAREIMLGPVAEEVEEFLKRERRGAK